MMVKMSAITKALVVLLITVGLGTQATKGQIRPEYNLKGATLATRWDEAIPLGNGMLGALIWQKKDKLRFSLDRADLWDLRIPKELEKLNFKWVEEQVMKKKYDTVQALGDEPYGNYPYATKLPGAVIEFKMGKLGKATSVILDIKKALCTVQFDSGIQLETFVHAEQPYGVFRFSNVADDFEPELLAPNYANVGGENKSGNSSEGLGLEKLGYQKGTFNKTQDASGLHTISYLQKGWGDFYYVVSVSWIKKNTKIEGSWTITAHYNDKQVDASKTTAISKATVQKGFDAAFGTHEQWWKSFWSKSAISIPDALIAKQYYLDQYKFGCVARKGAPAITLQAVWTADNGSLPPWKGDFHNDLNTQLSYWPAYSSNHLVEASSFTDWLWKIKAENKRYTKHYFGVEGLNVPGVATLEGQAMGGWIQYSMSPTVAAWLSQHFYLQWRYSMDRGFLKDRAYPYLHEVATFLENITRVENGVRKLPLSSSPEINDNSIDAWFKQSTNYDLALMKFAFTKAAELATEIGKPEEAKHWTACLMQLPNFAGDEVTGLLVAPNYPLKESHRHFSHMMAIHPLGVLDVSHGAKDKQLIDASLKHIEGLGTDYWVGYSFSWYANIYARAKQGDKAAENLRKFASNFVSTNSFHLNGDQKGGQYSKFKYRPFTLEGNFAFVSGLNEMLLQSHTGIIEVLPAIPTEWRKDISFTDLRTEGAYLVSLKSDGSGQVGELGIKSEKGGVVKVKMPFKTWYPASKKGVEQRNVKDGVMELEFKPGGQILLKNGYE